MALAADDRFAAAGQNEEPLIGAAVAVVRAAFGVAGRQDHLGRLGSAVAGDYAESPAEPQLLPDQLLAYCFFSVPMPPGAGVGVGVVVVLLPLPMPEPELPLDPEVVGLVVVPVAEPLVLPEAPLRASIWHLSRSAPVRLRHLLASLLPEDELPAAGAVVLPEDELPVEGVADGVVALPDAPAPVLPEAPVPEPEDCENATPDRARSAAAVAAVMVFNIMRRSPSKGGWNCVASARKAHAASARNFFMRAMGM